MKSLLKLCAIVLACICSKNLHAQSAVPEPVKQLMRLNGSWVGKTTMTAGQETYHFNYYTDFSPVANGNGLWLHEWGNIPKMGRLDGANIAGYDAADGKIHWYSVDNMGTTHEHIGEFSDADHFRMVHKSMKDGKEYMEVIDLEFLSKDKLHFKLVATLDGKEEQAMDAIFVRRVLAKK